MAVNGKRKVTAHHEGMATQRGNRTDLGCGREEFPEFTQAAFDCLGRAVVVVVGHRSDEVNAHGDLRNHAKATCGPGKVQSPGSGPQKPSLAPIYKNAERLSRIQEGRLLSVH